MPPPSQTPSSHSSDCFVRLGRHELVQLGVPGEAVFKGDDVAGTADQPAACSHIGDIAKLGIRDVQQARQFLPVGGRLIQQDAPLQVLGPKFFLQPVCSRPAFSSCGAASYPVQWQAAMPGSTDCLTERQGSGVSGPGT